VTIINAYEIYEPTDTERAIADAIDEGAFDEAGGTLGDRDWADAVAGS